MLKTNILQGGIDSDSIDQLQHKLKRYNTEIESLRGKGIGNPSIFLIPIKKFSSSFFVK